MRSFTAPICEMRFCALVGSIFISSAISSKNLIGFMWWVNELVVERGGIE